MTRRKSAIEEEAEYLRLSLPTAEEVGKGLTAAVEARALELGVGVRRLMQMGGLTRAQGTSLYRLMAGGRGVQLDLFVFYARRLGLLPHLGRLLAPEPLAFPPEKYAGIVLNRSDTARGYYQARKDCAELGLDPDQIPHIPFVPGASGIRSRRRLLRKKEVKK